MRLKSFYAKSMMEAMQMVRDALGENAIIVATREEAGTVRVTAAIDEDIPASQALGFGTRTRDRDEDAPAATRPLVPKPRHIAPDLYFDDDNSYEADEGKIIESLTDLLLRHGTPTDVMDAIISTATMIGLIDVRSTIRQTVEHMFAFHPLPQRGYRKPLMFVGTPGAGKTILIAKLATRAVLAGQKPAIVTTDTVRAGGVEQLASFAKILNVPLHRVRDMAELRDTLRNVKEADNVYIDTGGTNPFDVDDMRDLSKLTEAAALEPILVQAAGGDADEMAEIARCFAVLGVQRQVCTRLDISKKMGGLLACAHKAGLAFSDITTSPMPSNGLRPMTPQTLTQLMFGDLPTEETPASTKTPIKSNTSASIRGNTNLR